MYGNLLFMTDNKGNVNNLSITEFPTLLIAEGSIECNSIFILVVLFLVIIYIFTFAVRDDIWYRRTVTMYMPRNAHILLFGTIHNYTFLGDWGWDIVILHFVCRFI